MKTKWPTVDGRKVLTVAQVRKHKLEVWPEDTLRLPKGKHSCFEGNSKLPGADAPTIAEPAQIAEWYLFCNGAFIVSVHHTWIDAKVWEHYAKQAATGYKAGYSQRSNVQQALEQAGAWWPERIAPQVAGALSEVTLEEAGKGIVWSNVKDSLLACTYLGATYFCSQAQSRLVQQLYPDCTVHLARDLEAIDLWGARSVRACPFTFVDDGRVVGFVMPQRWREA